VLTGDFFVELSRPVRIATRMHCWKPPIVGGRLILWGKEAEHLTDLQKHIIQKPVMEHISNARLQPIQHIANPGSAQDGAHEILDTEQALLHKRTPDETDSKAQQRASKRSRGISPHNKSESKSTKQQQYQVEHFCPTAGVTTCSIKIDNNGNSSARPPGHEGVGRTKIHHR